MIPVITLSYVFRLLIFVFLFADFSNKNDKAITRNENGFAVVELFTSEGCSSCPSADETMIDLSKKYSDHVYFLGYHVDYWDHLGWKDEFSSRTFTKRQEEYATKFDLNSIYTPQVIVNGKTEFVGSDKHKLEETIEDELKISSNENVELSVISKEANKIIVSYKIHGGKTSDQLNIALVQMMATTQVKRGENRGWELHHINIVRELKTSNVIDGSIEFTVPNNVPAKELKIIAFTQNKNNLIIDGAVEAKLK